MRRSPRGGKPPARASRSSRAAHNVRRLWPYVLMAWERWQSLSPAEKERYTRRAREYAERGRRALEQRRGPQPKGRKRRS